MRSRTQPTLRSAAFVPFKVLPPWGSTEVSSSRRKRQKPEGRMARDLKGRIAVITGASGGIGAATAAELAARGCTLVLGARRLDRLEQVRADIHRAHPDAQVEIV